MGRISVRIAMIVEVVVAGFLFFLFMIVAGKRAWRFLLPEEEGEFEFA